MSSGMDCSTLETYFSVGLLLRKSKMIQHHCKSFFIVVLEGFVLYSVMSELQMASLDGDPSHNGFQDFSDKGKEERVSIYNNNYI